MFDVSDSILNNYTGKTIHAKGVSDFKNVYRNRNSSKNSTQRLFFLKKNIFMNSCLDGYALKHINFNN